MATALVTLLTDFGLEDYYVAAMKGTILRLAPQARLVDLSHQVPPGDVASGAFLLAAAVPTYPRGTLHLAVVDPGVGSRRRLLALRTPEALFLAPDNGLLSQFLDQGEVRHVDRPDLYLDAPGDTFHGRDRFAPVAAALLRGEPFKALGRVVTDPSRLAVAAPERAPHALSGEVLHVDRFGNLVTNIPAAWLPAATLRATVAGRHEVHHRVSHYAELPPGEPGILIGSLGLVELALKQDSLAEVWDVRRGVPVAIAWERPGE